MKYHCINWPKGEPGKFTVGVVYPATPAKEPHTDCVIIEDDNGAEWIYPAIDKRKAEFDTGRFFEEAAPAIQSGDFSKDQVTKAAGSLTIRAMAKLQWEWVERMDWHNKGELSALALVASEFGEAVAELPDFHPDKARFADLLPAFGRAVNAVRGDEPAPNFRLELADIVLRIADIAEDSGIDLEEAIRDKMAENEINGNLKGRKV